MCGYLRIVRVQARLLLRSLVAVYACSFLCVLTLLHIELHTLIPSASHDAEE